MADTKKELERCIIALRLELPESVHDDAARKIRDHVASLESQLESERATHAATVVALTNRIGELEGLIAEAVECEEQSRLNGCGQIDDEVFAEMKSAMRGEAD